MARKGRKMLSVVMLLAGLFSPPVAHAQGGYTDKDVKACTKKVVDREKLEGCLKLSVTGNAQVFSSIAAMYDNGGDGIPQDSVAATRYLILAAKAGDTTIMHTLGYRLIYGNGIEKDTQQAMEWFRKGAAGGNVAAQLKLAKMLLDEKDGHTPNPTEAIPWLVKASSATDPAQLKLASDAQSTLLLWLGAHPTPANQALQREWHQRVSASTNGDVLLTLAQDFFFGRGVESNLVKARSYAIRAIDAGSSGAYSVYAYILLKPEVGEPNFALARQILEKGQAAGNVICEMLLTDLDIIEGKATQDPVRFRQHLEASWVKFQKSCDAGDDCGFMSAKYIAIAREMGIGGAVDLKGAREVYETQKKYGFQGTESRLSEGNPWAQRDSRIFWQKSLLTDVPAFTADQQREFGITKLRDVTPATTSGPGTRPVLDFDIQVFVDKTTTATEAQLIDHINSAARVFATCDVRLRKARIWSEDSAAMNDKINLAPQSVINVFVSHPSENKKTAGDARMNDKSVRIYWQPGQIEAGANGRGNGGTIFAHELGHIFAVPHPNNLKPSVMQYGMITSLAQTFTPEQCELIRKHELLATSGPMAPTQAAAPGASSKSSSARGGKSSATPAMNARYDAVFTDLRDLIAKDNRSPFSRYTLNALALKHNVPWSEVVNLLPLAVNWRPETRFSASRDFSSGQPADTSALDEIFYKKEDIKTLMESDLGAIRRYVVENRNLDVASLNIKEHVDLKAGQVWPSTFTQTVSKVSDTDRFTQYIVGDDFYTVDSKTGIIVHVQPKILNIIAGTPTPEAFVSRGSKLNTELIKRGTLFSPSMKAPSDLEAHGGLTPGSIPGGTLVTPEEVEKMLEDAVAGKGPRTAIISAINAPVRIVGAFGAAAAAVPGDFNDSNQKALSEFVKGRGFDKDQVIITYCHHSQCWASYNLALRLIALGFTNVKWMREGINGWLDRDYPLFRNY